MIPHDIKKHRDLHSKVGNATRVFLNQNAMQNRPWRATCDDEFGESGVVPVKMMIAMILRVRVLMTRV